MKRIFLLLVAIGVFLGGYAKENVVSKTFAAQEFTSLKIESKYGEVKVENWDRNEIAINVFIEAQSNKEQTVEKILSNVGVDFSQNEEQLVVKTDFGMFFSFMKLSNRLFRNGKFAINYEVKMPKNIALDISLDNGDIILFERNANVRLTHSNGYISSENISANSYFKLRDSHLKIGKVDSLFFDVKGCTLMVEEAQCLKGESYNSQFEIVKIATFNTKSMRDTFTLIKTTEVFVNSFLSNIVIENLENTGILNASYGNVTVHKITPGFEELRITGKGTDIAINLQNTPAYVAVNHHSSTKIDISDGLGLRMKFGETQKDFITTGTIGNPTGMSQILINTKGGKLEMQ